jgi:serine/threonine protein kinase/WD40 repeat protein
VSLRPQGLELAPGDLVAGTYEIEALIGQGGMGAVFRARHRRLPGRKVAVKLLTNQTPHDALARFRREAEIASGIGHPNIIEVYDFDRLASGTPYMVMELLEGTTLAERIDRGPIPLHEVKELVRQIGSALHAAHDRGVVHRDLKPGNVVICPHPTYRPGLVKLLDFGISKMRGSTTIVTEISRLMGTPQYMPPEQAVGDHHLVDERADIFALGTMVREMLSGERTFSGRSLHEVVYKVIYTNPSPLRELLPELDERISNAVAKAMAKRREDRFARVSDFVEALTGQPLEGSPPAPSWDYIAPPAGVITELHGNAAPSTQQGGPTHRRTARATTAPTVVEKSSPSELLGTTTPDPKPRVWARRSTLAMLAGLVVVGALGALWLLGRSDRSLARQAAPDVARLVERGREALASGLVAEAARDLVEAYAGGERSRGFLIQLRYAMLAADARRGELGRDVVSMAVDHRAALAVTADPMGALTLWRTTSVEPVGAHPGVGAVSRLALADTIAVVVDDEGEVWGLDLAIGEQRFRYRDAEAAAVAAWLVSPALAAVLLESGEVVTLYTASGEVRARLGLVLSHAEPGPFVGAQPAERPELLFTASPHVVRRFDLRRGEVEIVSRRGQAGTPAMIAAARDGSGVAIAGTDGAIGLMRFERDSRSPDEQLIMPDGLAVAQLELLPSSAGVVVRLDSGAISLVDTQGGTSLGRGDSAVMVDGHYLAIATDERRLRLYDTDRFISGRKPPKLELELRLGPGNGPVSLYHAARDELLVADGDVVSSWATSLSTWSVAQAARGEEVMRIAYSHDGSRLLAAGERAGSLLHAERGDVLSDGLWGDEPHDVHIAGDRFASEYRVWDAARGEVICDLPTPTDDQRRPLVGALDDDRLLRVGLSGRARLFRTADCALLAESKPDPGAAQVLPMSSAAFHPTEEVVALGHATAWIELWNPSQGSSRRIDYEAPGEAFLRLVFTEDGDHLLSRAHGEVNVFDWRAGDRVTVFDQGVLNYDVREDLVLTRGRHTQLRLWQLPHGELRAEIDHAQLAPGEASDFELLPFEAVIGPGELIATSSIGGELALWDALDGTLLLRRNLGRRARLAFRPGSDELALAAGPKVMVWNVAPEDRPAEELRARLAPLFGEPVIEP